MYNDQSKSIITTSDLANFLKLCNHHLIQKYGIDLIGVLQLDIEENTTEILMMLLMQFEDVKEIIKQYKLYDIIYDFIDELQRTKIYRLSTEDLSITLHKGEQIENLDSLLTEKQLEQIFKALEHNMYLYEKLYKDKVFIIDSSIGKKAKVTISSTRLFHILGLEEKVIKANMQEFESVFNHSDNIKSLMTDRKDLFTVLEKILANETRIINAVLEGKLNHTFNFPKIEMKNYAFERMGMLEHSSGVIFYDKTIDTSLEAKTSHLKADLFLLNDFIRNYDLDFVFSAYRPYKFSRNFSMINKKTNIQNNLPTSDAESLFISSKGWENSRFLNGQLSSISESVGIYHKNNFDYTIFLEDESELPTVDPDEYIEFSDEDKARMANVIIENLPNLDNSHLKNLYDELTKGNKTR
mgnify:CR=1 FL=1